MSEAFIGAEIHKNSKNEKNKIREKVEENFKRFNEKIGYSKKSGDDDPYRDMVLYSLKYRNYYINRNKKFSEKTCDKMAVCSHVLKCNSLCGWIFAMEFFQSRSKVLVHNKIFDQRKNSISFKN